MIFKSNEVIGDYVYLRTTNIKHFKERPTEEPKDVVESFGETLSKALSKINEKQLKANELATKMVVSPDEVNVHDVMIAIEEAMLSLNFLKAIRDRALRAYQEIITMR